MDSDILPLHSGLSYIPREHSLCLFLPKLLSQLQEQDINNCLWSEIFQLAAIVCWHLYLPKDRTSWGWFPRCPTEQDKRHRSIQPVSSTLSQQPHPPRGDQSLVRHSCIYLIAILQHVTWSTACHMIYSMSHDINIHQVEWGCTLASHAGSPAHKEPAG